MKIENLSESLKENTSQQTFYNGGSTSPVACSTPDANQSDKFPKLAQRRSLIEKQLETSLSPEMTSFKSVEGSPTNTSRYGRARKQKTYNDYLSSEASFNSVSKPDEKINLPLQPAVKCYPSPKEKSVNLYVGGSRETPPLIVSPVQKVYVRKDLIQKPRGIEDTARMSDKIFTPEHNYKNDSIHTIKKETESPERCNNRNSGCNDAFAEPEIFLKIESEESSPKKNNLEASCPWKVGDIAWARLGRHPFWPCMVTREPNNHNYVKKKRLSPGAALDIIHITFFADLGRRCWIISTLMKKFTTVEDFYSERDAITPEMRKKNPKYSNAFSISQKVLPKWQSAVNEAEMILRRPQHLRSNFFVELAINMSNSQTPFKNSIKKKIKSENNERSNISLSESLFEALFITETSTDNNKTADISNFSSSSVSNAIVQRKLTNQTHMDRWLLKAKTPSLNGSLDTEKIQSNHKAAIKDVVSKSPKTKIIKGTHVKFKKTNKISKSKSDIKLKRKCSRIIDNSSDIIKITHNKLRCQRISDIFSNNNERNKNILNYSNDDIAGTSNTNSASEKTIQLPSPNEMNDSTLDVSSSDDIIDDAMSHDESVLLNNTDDIVTSTTIESTHVRESSVDEFDTDLSEKDVSVSSKIILESNLDAKIDIISPTLDENLQIDDIETPVEALDTPPILYTNVSDKSKVVEIALNLHTDKKQTKILSPKLKQFNHSTVSNINDVSSEKELNITELLGMDKDNQKGENNSIVINTDQVIVIPENIYNINGLFEKPTIEINKIVNVTEKKCEILEPNLDFNNDKGDAIITDRSEHSQIDTTEKSKATFDVSMLKKDVFKKSELLEIVNPVNVDLNTDNEQTIPLSSRQKSNFSTQNIHLLTGLSSDKEQNIEKPNANGKVCQKLNSVGDENFFLQIKTDQVNNNSTSGVKNNKSSESGPKKSAISDKQILEIDSLKVTEIIDDILKKSSPSDNGDIVSAYKSKDFKIATSETPEQSLFELTNTNVSKSKLIEIAEATEVNFDIDNEQTIPLARRKLMHSTPSTVSQADLSLDKTKKNKNSDGNDKTSEKLYIKSDQVDTISGYVTKNNKSPIDSVNTEKKNLELDKDMNVTEIIDEILIKNLHLNNVKGDIVSTDINKVSRVNTTITLEESTDETNTFEKSEVIEIAKVTNVDSYANNERTMPLFSRRKSMRLTLVSPADLLSDKEQNINENKSSLSTEGSSKIIDTPTLKSKSLPEIINNSAPCEAKGNAVFSPEHNVKILMEHLTDTDPNVFSVNNPNKRTSKRSLESLPIQGKIKVSLSKNKLNYNDPSFLFYYNTNIDLLFDKNPDISLDEARNCLYDAWSYEQMTVNDAETWKREVELRVKIAGVDDIEAGVTPTVKRIKKESNDTEKSEHKVTPRSKPTRATIVRKYTESNSDDDDTIENHTGNIPTDQQKSTKEDETSTSTECNDVDTENDPPEMDDYMIDLLKPHPSIYKGLLKEKICEKCEKPTNLLKCKGLCGGMYHVECMSIPTIISQDNSAKKIRGRKSKSKTMNSTIETSNETPREEPEISNTNSNSSISIDQENVLTRSILTANANEFEKQLSERMKEMIDESKVIIFSDSADTLDDSWETVEAGKCEIVDFSLLPEPDIKRTEKCWQCLNFEMPVCFVCKSEKSPKCSTVRQRCSVPYCNKYYHLECLDRWPQTKFNSTGPSKNQKVRNNTLDSITCPRHMCHTCISDNPRANESRFVSDKLARCIRCPATYHQMDKCTPAGTTPITAMNIVCPRHCDRSSNKTPCHVNTAWCFLCAKGGTLICCDTCPTSFHAECLNISPPEGGYICEDCETGRLPLIGELVWAKLGQYRWWPGHILHPTVIPKNILALPHQSNEFVVRFFGQHDHNWFKRGRVFPYQTGDTGYTSSKKSLIDIGFIKAVEEAQKASTILEGLQLERQPEQSQMPPRFIKLKVNRPVGNLASVSLHSAPACECQPNQSDPCGPSSDCLNRMLLTECSPQTCPAGTLCGNRGFEQRNYPDIAPGRTNQRGWGLITNEAIAKGQFVIEYVGEVIDEVEFKRRMQRKHETKDENYYFLTLDKDRMIDAGPKGNYARFMNHSCEPNCETQKWTVNGDTRVGLFALQDIAAGSELTFNYKFDVSDGTGGRQKCFCGAKRCAGLIGAKLKQEETQPKKTVLKKKNQVNVKRKYTKTSDRWSKGSKVAMRKIKPAKISNTKAIPPPKMPSYVEDDLKLINGESLTVVMDKLTTDINQTVEVSKRKHLHSPDEANSSQKRIKMNESLKSARDSKKRLLFTESYRENGETARRSCSRKST